MAKKSKTQRVKAQTAKANKRDRQQREELAGISQATETTEEKASASKGGFLKKDDKAKKAEPAAAAKKEEKPKKTRFKFIKDVRAELKRVTWPTRTDVLRWSGVVVVALLFFGIFTGVLDNLIITPALVALTGLGA